MARGGEASETDSERDAREAKEKEMMDAVAASQAEVAEMRRRQSETNRKQESLERQMAELMARMNLFLPYPQPSLPRRLQHFVPLCPCMLPNRQSRQQEIIKATITGRQRLGWMLT